MSASKPVMLIVLDGLGLNERKEHNGVAMATAPNLKRYMSENPYATLLTSGTDVGLPARFMGNSEVGHQNLGAGRIVWQDMMRITNAIIDDSFNSNPALLSIADHAKKHNGRLHFIGLIGDAIVHSCNEHYYALLRFAARQGFGGEKCVFHCLMDGRDTPPTSGAGYINDLWTKMSLYGTGIIGTVVGRYWGMDRDSNWDRVRRSWDAMVEGKGAFENTDAVAAVKAAYERKKADGYAETDEFIEPTVIVGKNGKPVGTIQDGDGVFFFNFRGDRARALTKAFVDPAFKPDAFKGTKRPAIAYATMTEYIAGLPAPVAFGPEAIMDGYGEIIEREGLKQLRIAETEKYAHVTFFFSGRREAPYAGEDRILVPSPKEVPTYDQKPQMSAPEVCDKVIEALESKKYDTIVLNFANCDMVGHTGIEPAIIKAVETVDECVGRIEKKLKEVGGIALVT
ncbi:MAG: 2,3-bisphosphoglycerate-independent phosphoglycerate mutase, partial [Planctomycetota bacterium]